MKKKILSGILALALLTATGLGVDQSLKRNVDLSDLALANIEALAQNENSGGSISISCNYADLAGNLGSGTFMWHCEDCTYSLCKNRGNTSTCTRY